MRLRSYAKINLTLDILGKRADGFHELETFLQEIDLFDEIELSLAEELTLECTVKSLVGEHNAALKAARLLKEQFGVKKGAKIHINKNIPIGGGLGGGSANAATVLKGLNVLWGLGLSKEKLIEIGQSIGMDVAFGIIGGSAIGRGRGEQLEEVLPIKEYNCIILFPGTGVNTSYAYSRIDYEKIGKANSTKKFCKNNDLRLVHNDFEYSVLRDNPCIKEAKKTLGEGAMMSGSGACLFRLFTDIEDARAKYKEVRQKYEKVFLCKTRNSSVILADEMGFCYGVKRALEKISMMKDKKHIVVVGNLIHNKQVTDQLKSEGIEMVDDFSLANKKVAVISSHGIADRSIGALNKKGLDVVDLTCPYVKAVHNVTKSAESKGKKVLVYGDRQHTEVKGIVGNLHNFEVIKNNKDLDKINKTEKVVLVSQTTRDINEFDNICAGLKQRCEDVEIIDTICSATKGRQKSAIKLAKNCDIVIVIGGYISSNTIRLTEICEKYCETKHIETDIEIDPSWFFNKRRIGITAGASTPDWIIDKIVKKVEMLK